MPIIFLLDKNIGMVVFSNRQAAVFQKNQARLEVDKKSERTANIFI